MKLIKFYIVFYGMSLVSISWTLLIDNTRSIYYYVSNELIAITGLILGIIILISSVGLYFEKKIAYIIVLTVYLMILLMSIIHFIITVISYPETISHSMIGTLVVVVSFTFNLIIMYNIYKKIRQFDN